MKRIIYITDGNETQGLGHIYQSKTFASYLKRNAAVPLDITFVTKSNEDVNSLISAEGFDVKKMNSDTEIFNFLKQQNPQIIIFDKVDVCPDLAKRIKTEIGCKLVIFTNLTSANDYADLSVMATMGTHFKNIRQTENGKTVCLGPKFLILRDEFFKYQNAKQNDEKTIDNILLQFGGADPAKLTLEAVKVLSGLDKMPNIYVVIGVANPQKSDLEKFISDKKLIDKIIILSNVKNIAELMSRMDLCLVSPGISFFEALFVSVPVMCFYQNQMQFEAWHEDVELFSKNDLPNIAKLIYNRRFIFPESNYVQQMHIAEGMPELLEIIINE